MSQTRKNEIIVGIFVLIVLAILFGMTFLIRGSTGISPYVVRAEFPSVAGLEIGSPVLVQGFRLGRVTSMEPGRNEEGIPTVVVYSKIASTIPIYKDATVTLVQQGFIGDKRLEIDPGTEASGPFESGSMVKSIPPVDITAAFSDAQVMVDDLKATLKSLREFTTDADRLRRIDETIKNVHESTERLNAILEANEEQVKMTVENVRRISEESIEVTRKIDSLVTKTESQIDSVGTEVQAAVADIRQNSKDLTARIDQVLTKADEVGDNANSLLVTSKDEVQEISSRIQEASDRLNTILKNVNDGRGTVGRLFQDPKPIEDLQASLAALRQFVEKEEADFYTRRITYHESPAPGGADDATTTND